jgi:F0F1-type ATP synthase assembly protein I
MADSSQKSGGLSPYRLSGMGMEFLSAILAGLVIGYAIDRWWLGSYPTGTVVGAIMGIIVGGVSFIRTALSANREAMESYRREHPGGKPVAREPERDEPDSWDEPDVRGGSGDWDEPDATR